MFKTKAEKVAFVVTMIAVTIIVTCTNIPEVIREKIGNKMVVSHYPNGAYCYKTECYIPVKDDDNSTYFIPVYGLNDDDEFLTETWHIAPKGLNVDSPEWDNYTYVWWSGKLADLIGEDRYVVIEKEIKK